MKGELLYYHYFSLISDRTNTLLVLCYVKYVSMCHLLLKMLICVIFCSKVPFICWATFTWYISICIGVVIVKNWHQSMKKLQQSSWKQIHQSLWQRLALVLTWFISLGHHNVFYLLSHILFIFHFFGSIGTCVVYVCKNMDKCIHHFHRELGQRKTNISYSLKHIFSSHWKMSTFFSSHWKMKHIFFFFSLEKNNTFSSHWRIKSDRNTTLMSAFCIRVMPVLELR